MEAAAKADESRLEIGKLTNERNRLILEIDEWQGKYNKSQRELKGQKEDNEDLRDQLKKAKEVANELEAKNNSYNKRLKDIEQEIYDSSKKDAKLVSIEDMIVNMNAKLKADKEEESLKEVKSSEELVGYKKSFKKLGNLLKRLTQALLKDQRLRNRNVQDSFKFGTIALDNRDKLYKSLLKIIGALHYVNKTSGLVRKAFDHWKESLRPKVEEEQKSVNQEPVIELKSQRLINKELPKESIKETPSKYNQSNKSFEDYDYKPYELDNNDLLNEYKAELEAIKKRLKDDPFKESAPIIYYRIINGITRYFFNIYLIILKDAKLKRK